MKHLTEYLRIIKGGVIPSSAMNKETLLRAMVKHGMTDEVNLFKFMWSNMIDLGWISIS